MRMPDRCTDAHTVLPAAPSIGYIPASRPFFRGRGMTVLPLFACSPWTLVFFCAVGACALPRENARAFASSRRTQSFYCELQSWLGGDGQAEGELGCGQ